MQRGSEDLGLSSQPALHSKQSLSYQNMVGGSGLPGHWISQGVVVVVVVFY